MSYTNQPPYTLTAMGSQLRERMIFAAEQEIPEICPDLRFKRLVKYPAQENEGDEAVDGGEPSYQQLEDTTDSARWRSIYIKQRGAVRGDNSENSDTRQYALRLDVIIGYPTEALFKLDPDDDAANIYDTEDLMLHDLEQLNDVFNGDGTFGAFAGEAVIPGFINIEFLGEARGTNVMTLSYLLRYERQRS